MFTKWIYQFHLMLEQFHYSIAIYNGIQVWVNYWYKQYHKFEDPDSEDAKIDFDPNPLDFLDKVLARYLQLKVSYQTHDLCSR
jgi:hypothetical protein